MSASRLILLAVFFDGRKAMISEKFVSAVKQYSGTQYSLAWKAGIHPVTLTQIVTGYIRPLPGDKRVLKVAAILGIEPGECWEVEVRRRVVEANE